MTYCLAIKLQTGIVLASDSRTNAGVDYVSIYNKMNIFQPADDRCFFLLSAGNLATSQGVVNLLTCDLETAEGPSLKTVDHLFEAADYVGELSRRVQHQHAHGIKDEKTNLEASFILGGQITGMPHDLYLIYPAGNAIAASPVMPFLQIGETKYGKPILDRIVTPELTLEDAARCALVSLDSTMRSNLSVGPPFELCFYEKDALVPGRRLSLDLESPFYDAVKHSWNQGLQQAFAGLPRFEWEQTSQRFAESGGE